MIENLLVDPDAIWDALATVHHKLTLKSPAEVENALDAICSELEDHESARRIKAAVGARTFRVHDPVREARQQVEQFAAELVDTLTSDHFNELRLKASAAVAKTTSEAKRREFFDGKEILDRFFKRFVHATGMSKEIFVYETAKHAGERSSVSTFVTALFAAIGIDDQMQQVHVIASAS